MQVIYIDYQPVELYKVLKLAGAASGGSAKQLISERQVSLNGNIETQKRKKIFAGDTINFMGQELRVVLNP